MSNPVKTICAVAALFWTCGTATATSITHNWSVQIKGHDYGLQEYCDPPDIRNTLIFYSADWPDDRIVHLPIYSVAFLLVAIASIPPRLAVYFYARYRRRHRNAA